MIRCPRHHFEAVCASRGASLDEAMKCVVLQEGDSWVIDVDHPAYPRSAGFTPAPVELRRPAAGVGPGTELKKLLATFGIHATEGCSCNAIARQMDLWGPDECEKPEHMELVLAGMRDNAASRGIPFVDLAARLLIRRAIHNARRCNANRPPLHAER